MIRTRPYRKGSRFGWRSVLETVSRSFFREKRSHTFEKGRRFGWSPNLLEYWLIRRSFSTVDRYGRTRMIETFVEEVASERGAEVVRSRRYTPEEDATEGFYVAHLVRP